MADIIVIFVINDKTLSSYMAQISEHINSSNQKIHSYDQMREMFVILGSKECEYNKNSTCQLNHSHNSLLMIIVDTHEKYVSKIDRKLEKKIRKSLVN